MPFSTPTGFWWVSASFRFSAARSSRGAGHVVGRTTGAGLRRTQGVDEAPLAFAESGLGGVLQASLFDDVAGDAAFQYHFAHARDRQQGDDHQDRQGDDQRGAALLCREVVHGTRFLSVWLPLAIW